MKIEFSWEVIDKMSRACTSRAKIIGGWVLLYKILDSSDGEANSMVFIPDPDHDWEIVKP